MKKFLLAAIMAFSGFTASSQVGIGTLNPSDSAELEVKNPTKGVLITRVNLVDLNVLSPIEGAGSESLIVYNLTVNSSLGLDKGFYYWTGTKWEKLISFSEVSSLVNSNETVTTLVNNGAGVYTYTNEAGTTTTINVPADVISNFNDIVSNTSVLNQIIEIIQDNGGNVFYNGTTMTYVDVNGVTQVINLADIVTANETVTTLVDNGNGSFTYTNEAGTPSTINYTPAASTDDWKLAGNSIAATSFLGTTNNQPLVLKSNNSERVRITPTGRVGVNATTPVSSFEVQGSVGNSIVSKTADYTATEQDYTIVYKHTVNSTLTLPNPTTCTGRKYLIINNGSLPLRLVPGIAMGADAGTTLYTTSLGNGVGVQEGIVYGNRLLIQSDGVEYIILNN